MTVHSIIDTIYSVFLKLFMFLLFVGYLSGDIPVCFIYQVYQAATFCLFEDCDLQSLPLTSEV